MVYHRIHNTLQHYYPQEYFVLNYQFFFLKHQYYNSCPLNKYDILADELLFIDDNSDNIRVADELNINTIKVEKDMNLLTEIIKVIDNCLIK